MRCLCGVKKKGLYADEDTLEDRSGAGVVRVGGAEHGDDDGNCARERQDV